MIPFWLHILSIVVIAAGVVSAGLVAADAFGHPQQMRIMNLVWPAVSLFGLGWLYVRYGRSGGRSENFSVAAAKATCHCGAGCALGDICAETICSRFPAIDTILGYGWLFGQRLFAIWVADYVFAFAFGIIFQFFTIAPMRQLSIGKGIMAAVKADTLSLTAWQVGMYGFMAIAALAVFPIAFGARIDATQPEFWYAMQIAMLCGFLTSYPVNGWLLRRGIKERM